MIDPRNVPDVEPDDLWIGDRNFCTLGFMFGITDRLGNFLLLGTVQSKELYWVNANSRGRPIQERSTNKSYVSDVKRVVDI